MGARLLEGSCAGSNDGSKESPTDSFSSDGLRVGTIEGAKEISVLFAARPNPKIKSDSKAFVSNTKVPATIMTIKATPKAISDPRVWRQQYLYSILL